MTQYYNPGTIAVMVNNEIMSLVGDAIGQQEFFNARIFNDFQEPDTEKGETAGQHYIMIKYYQADLRINLRFGLIMSTDKKTLAVGGLWLYENDPSFTDLQERLGKHMRECVGDTIRLFLKDNAPKKRAE